MTYKQIEASREVRLWISQVIIPTVTVVGMALTVPEIRQTAATKFNSFKTSIKNKFKKEEGH